MLKVYQCWTSVSDYILASAVMKGPEMGHFGGGNSFKITGDQLPRVPDDEVEGISKKKSLNPSKNQKDLDTWAKFI